MLRYTRSGHLPPGGDHHPGGGVFEHVVDRVAEDVAVAPAWSAEDDDLGAATLRLLDDRAAGVAGADDTLDRAHPVRPCHGTSIVEQAVGLRQLLSQVGVERQL